VTSTGRPLVMREVDWAHVERALPDPAAREALARLGVGSATVVPLVARGQTLGALGLFNREERGPLSPAEVETAIEIGLRAGLALHHARLFGQQRDLADALQRSMLTAPPEPNPGRFAATPPRTWGGGISRLLVDEYAVPSASVVEIRPAPYRGRARARDGFMRGVGF